MLIVVTVHCECTVTCYVKKLFEQICQSRAFVLVYMSCLSTFSLKAVNERKLQMVRRLITKFIDFCIHIVC